MNLREKFNLHLLDCICLLATITVCVFSILAAVERKEGNPVVVVTAADTEYIYRLDRDEEIHVQGLKGVSVIQVAGGSARFVESPCANQTCIATAPASKNGDWAACMPNGIFIRIESTRQDAEIDIISF